MTEFFNNELFKVFIRDTKDFYFSELSHDLKSYRRNIWHAIQLKTLDRSWILRDVYFSAPWSMINFVGGIVLVLILTAIRIYCSITQIKQGKD